METAKQFAIQNSPQSDILITTEKDQIQQWAAKRDFSEISGADVYRIWEEVADEEEIRKSMERFPNLKGYLLESEEENEL